jgi:putative ABC transport system ATP-binding protein
LNILTTNKLCRHYQKGNNQISALHDVSIEMESGSLVSIVGKSGSGKSTFLNLAGALDRPTSGSLLFRGKNLATMSRNEMAFHRRFGVGMIFQSFNLNQSRNALENVELALAFGGLARNKRHDKAAQLLEKVGLSERLKHRPDELSGGETQRVAIARALANNPGLLLADEPTGNLDSETAADIIRLILDLNKNQGLSVLLVTHDMETATKISDQVIRLKDGRVEYNTKM